MTNLWRWKRDVWVILGLAVLPLLLFWDVTVNGRTLIPADNLFQWEPWASDAALLGVAQPHNTLLTDLVIENYAWKRFAVQSVQAGEIPLWNPYLFAGAPFLATGQHSMLYPFSWLFLLLPLSAAYGWYTVSQLWLAGVMMYLLGRVLGLRRASATIAGLVYQGSGFLLTSAAVFPMILGASVWLPLLLACVDRVVGGGGGAGNGRIPSHTTSSNTTSSGTTLFWAALGSVALGLHILAGHIEMTYYTLLIMGLYALWRLLTGQAKRKPLPVLGWLLGMVLVGLMLGAVQLVPFVEVGQANFRSGETTLAQVRSYAFPVRRALTLLLPNFFGNPAHHSYVDLFSGETVPFDRNFYGQLNPRGAYSSDWGLKNYVEGGIYLGILPLFLAGLGVWGGQRPYRRRAQMLFFLVLAVLSLLFIFGTPLYGLIYYGLPFADQIRTPFRWVFPLTLAVAVLAGMGLDYLAETRQAQESERVSVRAVSRWWAPFFLAGRPSLITGLAGGAVWGGLLLLGGLWASRLAYAGLEARLDGLFHGLALADEAFPHVRAFYSYEFRQVWLLGLMLLAVGATLRVSRCPIFVRRRPIYLYMAVLTLMLDLGLANVGFHTAVSPDWLTYQPDLITWLTAQPGLWRLTSFAPHGDKPLNANSAWLYDLTDIRGYDSIILKQYADYMTAIEPQNELPYNRIQPIANWQSLNSPLLDVLTVRYIVTAERIDLPKLQLAWEGGGLRVYENLAVAPRAYTLPETSTAVTDDPLVALRQFDPRQYVVVARADDPLAARGSQPAQASPYTPARIESYGNNEVVVTAETAGPAWLILNDSYFPGWKAWIRPSGAEAETQVDVIRVNGNFRGVRLPAGAWTVRFRYSPTSFQLGGLLSALGVVILIFGSVVWGWRRVVTPQAELTTTRSIAKNSAAPMVLNLFNKGIDFLFAAFYLRVLGPAEAGSFATAVAAAGIFDILANFGLDLLVIREVSQDRRRAGHFLLNTTILRLGAGLVACLPMIALVGSTSLFSNPFSRPEVVAIGLIMLGMLFSGMSKGVTGLFYVYEQAEVPAAMTTATTILKVGFGIVALLLGFGFVGLAAVSILTNIVTLSLLAGLAYRRFALAGPWAVDWALQRRMVGQGFPLMLIHLLQTVFISVDVYLLRLMLPNGEEVVGWYSSAYKWFNALQIVPSFFTLALFPIISREIQRDPVTARRMYQMALKIMLLLALPIATLTAFLAYPLVQLLGGEKFLPHGAIALQLVIWSIPIGWLNSVTNYVLIALGLERMQPRAFALAVGFNIMANVLFIPRFSYVAAAVITILSEVVLLLVFNYYLQQKMVLVGWGRLLVRPFLAALLMAGGMAGVTAVASGSPFYPILAAAVGVGLYPVGLWLWRVLGDEEWQILQAILPRRLTAWKR